MLQLKEKQNETFDFLRSKTKTNRFDEKGSKRNVNFAFLELITYRYIPQLFIDTWYEKVISMYV